MAAESASARRARPAELDAAAEPALPQVAAALEKLASQPRVAAGGVWGSAQAFFLASLAARTRWPWLAIVSTEAEAVLFASDLQLFGASPTLLPARDAGSEGRREAIDPDAVRARLEVAERLSLKGRERPRILVASVLALVQPLPEPGELARGLLELAVGAHLDTEHLLHRLVDAGYERVPLVERPGEVSVRGDIADLHPFAADLPLRIEVFDGAIESLRTFEPADQRSVAVLERATVNLARDPGGVGDGHGVLPFLLFPHDTAVAEIEPLRVADRAEGLRIRSASHQRALGLLRQAIEARRRVELQSLPAADLHVDSRSVQALSGGIRQAPELLRAATADGSRAVVVCRNEAEEHRFRAVLAEAGGVERVDTWIGSLAKGFRLPALQRIVVDHRELVGVAGVRRIGPPRAAHKSKALQSFFELRPGDWVVHAVHGLALYKGLVRMARGGGEEEHLHLVFADDVVLYVPATRIDLVQRYIGSGSSVPPLDKIGGTSFRRRREKVERALYDLAADLLEVQAKRELSKREPWRPDESLVRELAGSFPFVDTPDQATADREITADLAAPGPMDRLLCGDVGFGKTEIAIRAAFRVAAAGGQVAVLVPTTVLAHQHLATFRERLADFPVEVAALSRTATGRDERETLERIASGEIDVAIGTHRLLSKDVRFARLGLVIIDEEQRFGVAHKEHFKALRETVDVLALSATPIPRTLHMSLSGVRDISALSIPPPGRLPIATEIVDRTDDARISAALAREKARGGQAFFLHNRVETIERVARRLAELAPECSFAVGHGQMPARELEGVMDAFARAEIDVLVATTIVENGLDIPAAGTILIDEAERYGLSELHQLRGRVGRGEQQAFCYLLVDPLKPMRQVARERLKALEELSHLGAGFALSMKDLELRGAGNLLGAQQSGHIAAVGYDMYCRLLKQTIERARAGLGHDREATEAALSAGVELELGLRAFLPEGWIPTDAARLDALRELDTVHTEADADAVEAALRDRFGKLPGEALALVRSFRLRARAAALGLRRIAYRGDVYVVEFADRVALETALAGSRVELRPILTGVAHLVVPQRARTPESALAWLEGVLKTGEARQRIPPILTTS